MESWNEWRAACPNGHSYTIAHQTQAKKDGSKNCWIKLNLKISFNEKDSMLNRPYFKSIIFNNDKNKKLFVKISCVNKNFVH